MKKMPDLKVGEGPITQSLDEALQRINVQRQAFHGRSFVGNHVHKCLKVILIYIFNVDTILKPL